LHVYHGEHGSFLRTFADAFLLADEANRELLRPVWKKLIEKYLLDKKVGLVPMKPLETEREVRG